MAEANPLRPGSTSVTHCVGKEGFATGAAAAKAKKRFGRGGRDVSVYRCLTCNLWHMGRNKLKKPEAKRTRRCF